MTVTNIALSVLRASVEAEYAFNTQKRIVALRLEPDYKPDGWLGPLCRNNLYYDCTVRYVWNPTTSQTDGWVLCVATTSTMTSVRRRNSTRSGADCTPSWMNSADQVAMKYTVAVPHYVNSALHPSGVA